MMSPKLMQDDVTVIFIGQPLCPNANPHPQMPHVLKATGIFLFDPEAIPNDAYKPATLYSCSDHFLESSASTQLETSDISLESSLFAQPEKVDQPNVNSIF